MKSIYASKLYRASSRKERIQAALASPGNLALVQQLADSLDEEYKTPENLGVESAKEESGPKGAEDFIVDDEINPETDLMTMDDLDLSGSPNKGSGSHSSHSPKGSSGPKPDGGDDKPSEDPAKDAIPDSPMTDTSEPAEASTKVVSTTLVNGLNALKDSLNAREDTKGVARVVEKPEEVWIYYKDEVNLNNIMTEVIEYIMNAGFSTLEFNRLARSDNAIVFVITESVGEPITASRKAEPVSPSPSVSDKKENGASSSETTNAIKWIRSQKGFADNKDGDDIVNVSKQGNDVLVTFKKRSDLVIPNSAIVDGSYKKIVDEALMGTSARS